MSIRMMFASDNSRTRVSAEPIRQAEKLNQKHGPEFFQIVPLTSLLGPPYFKSIPVDAHRH